MSDNVDRVTPLVAVFKAISLEFFLIMAIQCSYENIKAFHGEKRLFLKRFCLLSKVIKFLRVKYLLKPVFWTAKYLNDSMCKPAGLAFPNIPRFEYNFIHFRSNMHVSLDSGYQCTTKYVFLTKNGSFIKLFFFWLGVSLLILIIFRSINSKKK